MPIPSLLRAGLAASTVLLGLVAACGGSKVPEASCNACGSESYSAEQCRAWGEAVGCESSSFTSGSGSGCRNGCSFENCDEAPACGQGLGTPEPPDAGASDAAVDPRCAASDDGLFSSDPPCADADELNLNGATLYYCPCSSACPCGYVCGSIPLSVGGTIGAACAPK